jgi:hypothetical protein
MKKNAKLQRLSICPCGFPVLDDGIAVGSEYAIDSATLTGGFFYHCGGCGREQTDVQVVCASSILNPCAPLRPLPYDLFSLPM